MNRWGFLVSVAVLIAFGVMGLVLLARWKGSAWMCVAAPVVGVVPLWFWVRSLARRESAAGALNHVPGGSENAAPEERKSRPAPT